MLKHKDVIPDNTIALFTDKSEHSDAYEKLSGLFLKPNRNRDNFFPGSEHCKPFVLANQLGYQLTLGYGFNVVWDGGPYPENIHITHMTDKDLEFLRWPSRIFSNFGSGIVTIALDGLIRTPKGINTLILPPLNYVRDNATTLCGTVETDQTHHKFTFNIKLNKPHVVTSFPAGTPLATIIPIPRYFIEAFEIKDAEDLLSKDLFDKTVNKSLMSERFRNENRMNSIMLDIDEERDFNYLKGMDYDKSEYPEYQSQSGKKIIRNTTISQQDN